MLNSTEHEIYIAHKGKMMKIKICLALKLYDAVFILLINVKNIYEQNKFHAQLIEHDKVL